MTVPAPSASDLKTMYETGTSIRGISRATGIPAKTVHRRLRQAGTTFRSPGGQNTAGRPRPLTAAETSAIRAAYEQGGISLDSLGAPYQRSGDTIARILRRAGAQVRPRGRTIAAASTTEIRDDVAGMHRAGMRPADIAASIPGATAAGIASQLRSAGLTPHRGRPVPAGQDLAAAYAAAGSVRALAASLHADEDRIRDALASAGVPAGSLRRIPARLRPAAARLAAGGATPSEIAQVTGLPASSTSRLGQPGQTPPAPQRAA